MLIKELSFEVSRYMRPHPKGPEQIVTAPLTLTFFLRPNGGDSASLLDRYNAAGSGLQRLLSGLVARKMLIGATQSIKGVRGLGDFQRLDSEADCASLGTYLARVICPRIVSPQKLKIERLKVSFGVYETADCHPQKPATLENAYSETFPQSWRA